jgi:hypothetical protein
MPNSVSGRSFSSKNHAQTIDETRKTPRQLSKKPAIVEVYG